MRVLHVIAALDPKAGGPPRVAAQLSAATASQGHEVCLLAQGDVPGGAATCGSEGSEGGAAGVDANEVRAQALPSAFSWIPGIQNVRIVQLPWGTGLQRKTLSHLRSSIRRIVANHDVVHLHGVWDPLLFRTAEAARELNVPYIVRPAGMLDTWSLNQRKLKKKLALLLGYRRMLSGAAFIHALNEDERDMVSLLKLRAPIEVIPNGTFVEWMDAPPAPGQFRQRHPQLGDRPFVLFLSRLHYKKGLDYLADAFKLVVERVPQAMLVVAGPDEGAQAEFEARIRALQLSDRVVLTGPLYAKEKYQAIADATCFCLPSRQEGFSVAVIEALSIGTPVVISKPCHFPEVDEAGAGFTTPLEPAVIAAALERLLTDPILNARQSDAAVKLIRERYTWSSIVRACLGAYERRGVRAADETPRQVGASSRFKQLAPQ